MTRTALRVLLLGLLLAGCSTSETVSAPRTTTTTSAPLSVDYVEQPFNAAAADAKLAIIGVVRRLSTPAWNTESGGRPRTPHTYPARYRDASVEVTDVLWKVDPYTGIELGVSIDVRLLGGGSPNFGDEVAAPPKRYDYISGPVAIDDKVLWLLTDGSFDINTAKNHFEITVTRLVGDFATAWRIDNGKAFNLDPTRVMPVRDLVARLQSAHARSLQL